MRISEGGDAEFLRSRLRRFRRRALAAEFCDAFPSCLALSFAAWIVWAFLAGGNASLTAFALGGLLAALVSAAVRLPSLAGTARAVDRKAGLEQRLETAVELMEHPAEDDIVATLILRDARRATEKVASDVLPLRLGRGRATWGAFAILTVVLLLAAFFQGRRPSGSARFSPLAGGSVPENAVRMQSSELEPASGGVEVASPDEDDTDDTGESGGTSSSSEPAPAQRVSSTERAPDSMGELPAADVESDEEEWTPIEAALGRARGDRDGPSTAGTGGAGAIADRGAEGGRGESAPESRAESLPMDIPDGAGTHYESPSSQGGVPPGLREYVRAYFSKLRKTR